MNIGKTLFAQLMDFLPWSTFTRIVTRYGGDQRVRTLSCAEHYRAMAFAQLTYRESLRDIETCLSAQASKLYAMGFRDPVRRSTLADANEGRDWRIYAELAQRLIAQARKLYLGEDLGFDLANTVYALDSTIIDLCLAVFPWAHFRTAKAAVKMHTLLDLRGNIPSFIHISDGKLHDVHALDLLLPEAGAIYVMDRGYVDFGRLHGLHLAGAFFVTRAKSNMDSHRVYSAPADRAAGIICDQTIALGGHYTAKSYPEHLRKLQPDAELQLKPLSSFEQIAAVRWANQACHANRFQGHGRFAPAPGQRQFLERLFGRQKHVGARLQNGPGERNRAAVLLNHRSRQIVDVRRDGLVQTAQNLRPLLLRRPPECRECALGGGDGAPCILRIG